MWRSHFRWFLVLTWSNKRGKSNSSYLGHSSRVSYNITPPDLIWYCSVSVGSSLSKIKQSAPALNSSTQQPINSQRNAILKPQSNQKAFCKSKTQVTPSAPSCLMTSLQVFFIYSTKEEESYKFQCSKQSSVLGSTAQPPFQKSTKSKQLWFSLGVLQNLINTVLVWAQRVGFPPKGIVLPIPVVSTLQRSNVNVPFRRFFFRDLER